MADEQPTSERQITGDDVIAEILRNCNAGAFKIRYTVVIPCVYHVYLHSSDYEMIRPVMPALTAEARSALIDRLEELTEAARPSAIARRLGFGSDKSVEYKILDPDWTIEFHPDAEEKLKRGDIEIYSELASAQKPEFEGAMTRHVTKRRSDGTKSSASVASSPVAPRPASAAPLNPVIATDSMPTAAMPAAAVPSAPDHSATGSPSVSTTTPTSQVAPVGEPYALLHYEDANGHQTFPVTRNQIVIGRGGKSFWVDIKVAAPPDVSREHCRIRRDPASGQFFIKDVSQYGTSVNGRRIPSSIETLNGEQRDKNVELPLPPRCRVTLADVVDLEFEAVSR